VAIRNFKCEIHFCILSTLSVLERKVLGKIFGPTKEVKSIWRNKTHKELEE
jgi:hypothetical protein